MTTLWESPEGDLKTEGKSKQNIFAADDDLNLRWMARKSMKEQAQHKRCIKEAPHSNIYNIYFIKVYIRNL